MVQRVTPEAEIDRIVDRLRSESRIQIQDRDSFDLAFNDLVSLREDELSTKQKELRRRAFQEFADEFPDVSKERLFTKAGGKDLKRDREKTAKKLVRTEREFVQAGAKKSDLVGFDTAKQEINRRIAVKRRFDVPAFVRVQKTKRVKSVFARRVTITRRKKRVSVLRDSRGRFVSRR